MSICRDWWCISAVGVWLRLADVLVRLGRGLRAEVCGFGFQDGLLLVVQRVGIIHVWCKLPGIGRVLCDACRPWCQDPPVRCCAMSRASRVVDATAVVSLCAALSRCSAVPMPAVQPRSCAGWLVVGSEAHALPVLASPLQQCCGSEACAATHTLCKCTTSHRLGAWILLQCCSQHLKHSPEGQPVPPSAAGPYTSSSTHSARLFTTTFTVSPSPSLCCYYTCIAVRCLACAQAAPGHTGSALLPHCTACLLYCAAGICTSCWLHCCWWQQAHQAV